MELGGLVRKYRESLGLSQAQLGRAVGVSQATIDKIESGRTMLSRYLPRIAARLRIPDSDLAPFIGPPEAVRHQDDGLHHGRPFRETISGKPDLSAPSADADLPVFIANADAFPIDRVKRPPPLANVRDAYGLLIRDTAMEPEFWPGDIALVHPHLPPRPQSACVFKTEAPSGGERSQLKHLAGFDDAAWQVRQWNPLPGMKSEFTLSRKEWPVCHRVVGKYSRG